MATATDGCNVIGRNNFLAQKLEAKIVSLVSVHSHAHRFCLLLFCRRFGQYGVRNCESTLMQLWKCFTVSPFRSACLAMHQNTLKTKVGSCRAHAKQGGCRVRQQWELWSEVLVFWAALKQLSENEYDATCVASLRLIKTKTFNMVLSFYLHWHLTWQNWTKSFRRDILTLHRWKLP